MPSVDQQFEMTNGATMRRIEKLVNQRRHCGGVVRRFRTSASRDASPDDLWQYLQTDDKNHTRTRMDREVARARKKVECYW